MDLHRELVDLENQRIALQNCEKILKHIIDSEKVNAEFRTKYTYMSEGFEIEKPVICIMVVHLQKIFTNNCIIVETDYKDDKELTYISISFE
jgi:hypothetical protein